MVGGRTPRLSASALKEWLDLFSKDNRGKIKIINMFLSWKHDLIDENLLLRFLAHCISHGASTTHEAINCYDRVTKLDDTYFMLASVKPSSIESNSTIITTVDSTVFHEHIFEPPDTRLFTVLPEKPNSRSARDVKHYCDTLKKVTLKKWYRDTGTLGRRFPDPKRIWFTKLADLNSEIQADSSHHSDATKIRDALGLIDKKNDDYLLSMELSAGHLHAISNLKMGRPGFADDEDNPRFAVHLDNAPKNVYKNMWGLTVHLRKLKEGLKRIHGVPERVCSSIELSHIGDFLKVNPLGWVDGNRGQEIGIDDDEAFVIRLLGHSTIETIKNQLIQIANEP
jgi:hypothetical protein